jgi:hypothetical protein
MMTTTTVASRLDIAAAQQAAAALTRARYDAEERETCDE